MRDNPPVSPPSRWREVSGLDSWRVTEVSRRPQRNRDPDRADPEGDLAAAQRIAVLAAAYHGNAGPVAFAWLRDSDAGPVRVLAAGCALAAGRDGEQAMLKYPAGARGRAMPAGGLARALSGLPCWVTVCGVADSLLTGEPRGGDRARTIRPTLEDGLLAAWPGPFAWLVLAEPIRRADLASLAAKVALAHLEAMRFDEPEQQLGAERLRARHVELLRGRSTGMWRVSVLAGGETGKGAAEVAALLCGSADLGGMPYALVPEAAWASLEELLGPAAVLAAGPGGEVAGNTDAPAPVSPFAGSSELVAALARPPAREVPGVRFVLRPEFDTTPETGLTAAAGPGAGEVPALGLGTLLDRNRMPAGELVLPLTSLNRHVGVYGATGAGKSQTIRALLEQATAQGIPWLVVEPAKSEYSRGMAARLPDAGVIRIRPGEAGQPAAGMNPLEPAVWDDGTRFPLQTHADLVRSLFLAAFEADEPFPQVLNAALTRVYDRFGWDLVLGEPKIPGTDPGYPSLGDLQAAADQVVLDIGYGPEVERNVRGFISVRLGSLRLGTPGRFFEGGHPLDSARLLNSVVVLEIEDVGDDQDKAFVMGTVLIRLTEYLRLREHRGGQVPGGLRHLTVLEEAHRLLRRAEPGERGARAKAVEMFAALFAEVRAYGEGLVVAEQIPTKLVPDVIKNTAVKIVHRLPAADDRNSVGMTMNLTDEQSQYIVTLTPGEAAVSADGADYPWLARIADGTQHEKSSHAPTAPPTAIIGPRSASCGPHCQQGPCTLRQMRAAQRATETDPRITLWAELSVLAHLTGWAMPPLTSAFACALRAMDTQLRDCALAQAVDAAAAARAPAISARVSPHQLAAHITVAMRQGLDDGTWLCALEEPQYLAPPYRWALVRDVLRDAGQDGEEPGRHPRSTEWEHTYGQPVPGESWAAQLEAVQRRYAQDQRDTGLNAAVAWGIRPGRVIERAVGARASDEDWSERLADALGAFRAVGWVPGYLSNPGADGPPLPAEEAGGCTS
jgi:DNA helicase HerA-like ATPase